MPKSSRKPEAKTGAKPKHQRQQPPQHDLSSPKMRKVTRRLKDLQDEKAKIEQLIRQLKAQKALRASQDEGESDYHSQQSAAQNGEHQSQVSSLNSRAHPLEEEDKPGYVDSDDISVMTEDIYHYDARGRRVTDQDYAIEDTETTAAYHINTTTAISKQKPNTRESIPRVWIEWKRGRSYQPAANLAYYHVHHQHPTDLSLLVVDDRSFFDDLSFSSGDDSKLAAAATDMPMEIDLLDDESVNSALHSECSISVAPLPSKSMQVKSMRRNNSNELNTNNNPNLKSTTQQQPNAHQFLYRRSTSIDPSDEEDGIAKTNKEPARRRRRTAPPGPEDHDSPPPLTTDMSLVDDKDTAPRSSAKAPPLEISFSEKSLDSLDSLGSELGGVSLAPPQQQQQQQPPSAAKSKTKTKAAPENSKKNKKKTKKSKPPKETPTNNMLGERDSETEENELSHGALAFGMDESSRKEKAKVAANNNTKSPTKTKKASANYKKKSPPDLNSSASTLGAMTGMDTEAGVAAPRKQSSPVRGKTKNGKVATPAAKKASRKTGGGNGVKTKGNESDLKRQNSNSTCNSSLTSVPGDANNNRALVIEGGASVK